MKGRRRGADEQGGRQEEREDEAEEGEQEAEAGGEAEAGPGPEFRRIVLPQTEGGCSGRRCRRIATAFELTATEALRERYEVTVYQPGWRLGGKGASGRNQALGDRIEEHGLHIFFGFYDNAFDVMKRCYAELGRKPNRPLATWEDAFTPCDDIVLYDEWNGTWTPHHLTLPRNPLEPGSGDPVSVVVDKLGAFVAWLDDEVRRVMGEEVHTALEVAHFLPGFVRHAPIVGDLMADAERLGLGVLRRLLLRVDPVVHEVERVTVHHLLGAVGRAVGDIRPEHGFVEQGQGIVVALEALRERGVVELRPFPAGPSRGAVPVHGARHGGHARQRHPVRSPAQPGLR